jgi:hypothetical protein
MSNNNPFGAVGIDQGAPVYDGEALWKTWALHEIYTGKEGANRFIPKRLDWVVDLETKIYYEVISLDITTGLVELKEIKQPHNGVFDDIDVLMGAEPGSLTPPQTFMVYHDKKVIPHTMTIDSRLKVRGSEVVSMKLFKAKLVNGDLECISGLYDQTGNLLSQSIPLQLASFVGNVATKIVPIFHTREKLENGELVIARFYSAGGHMMSSRQLKVQNTGFQRVADDSVKYVRQITLETPFLSDADPTLIQYPINVLMQGLNLMGVVHYSDGSTRRLPVDGTKFEIRGLRSYITSVVGQKLPVVLQYNLSPGESGITTGEGPFVTAKYQAQTMNVDGNYTVKLFGYPVWVDGATGYRMEWFLYNLNRRVAYRATPFVRFNENTSLFDPTAYGVKQRLSVSCKLSDVSSSFSDYIHVQAIEVSLLAQGTEHSGTNWLIGFDPNQEPPFGRNNQARYQMINQNLHKINIANGETDYATWLDRFYRYTRPLFNDQGEIEAPNPTHIVLVFSGREVEFPIEQWQGDLTVSDMLTPNGTLFIKFIKRLADSDLQLAVAGMPIFQQA